MALTPSEHEETIKSKTVASNITVPHTGQNYYVITDNSLANKYLQGYKMTNVSNYFIYVARVLIDSTGLSMVLVNNGSSDATNVSVDIYYR